ncbi:MAG: hypothetical protein DSZ29_00510 [Aquificaceae bacterium]|nr:MAG: hypothetical protein DSZ29_00510 [Aquificaceae bacterium]
MQFKKNIYCYLSILLFSCQAQAFDTGFIESNTQTSLIKESDILQGTIFDRTITQIGFAFYQKFTQKWRAETFLHRHSITLRETPTARQGSIIRIEEGNTLLYKFTVGLRNQALDKKAEESLKAIRLKLKTNHFAVL